MDLPFISIGNWSFLGWNLLISASFRCLYLLSMANEGEIRSVHLTPCKNELFFWGVFNAFFWYKNPEMG